MIKYQIIIYWRDEDQAFIAEVPELPGCAADGKSHKEAPENVEVIIQEGLETAKESGRSIPKPKGRLIVLLLIVCIFLQRKIKSQIINFK